MAKKRSKRSIRATLPGAFYVTLACLLGSFGLVVYTQARLQVADRSEILMKAESAWMLERLLELPAERGTIYTSDNRVLARSRPASPPG